MCLCVELTFLHLFAYQVANSQFGDFGDFNLLKSLGTAAGAVFSGVNLGPLEPPRRGELNMEMVKFL